jgi:hypothetical protein
MVFYVCGPFNGKGKKIIFALRTLRIGGKKMNLNKCGLNYYDRTSITKIGFRAPWHQSLAFVKNLFAYHKIAITDPHGGHRSE